MPDGYLGYAQVNITPETPMKTIGFGNSSLSQGVQSSLMAQVTVWKRKAKLSCLAAIDHIGFAVENARDLRDDMARYLGTSRDQVMLCFSHTHAAPNESEETKYYEWVCQRVMSALEDAMADMKPVRAAWGCALGDIGVNRRSGSPIDKRIGVCTIYDLNSGAPKLLILRLTAHCNVLKADNHLISADYFGAARDMLTEKFGCPAMLTQGASGNVAPRFFASALNPPDAIGPEFTRSETALEDMAHHICEAVAPVIYALRPAPIERLRAFSKVISFPAPIPTREAARLVAEEAKRACGMDGTAWLAEVDRLVRSGKRSQQERVEVQYFALNEGCLCGVPCEIMCEIALRASRHVQREHFYLGGYTNGCTGYFPTEEEYDIGGYEVYWSLLEYYMYYGRVYPLRRDSAERLVAFVTSGASRLYSKSSG